MTNSQPQMLTDILQERSLATVTYLMSLSEMARTPFSLVDEINQGMDQKAERAVHNQLVDDDLRRRHGTILPHHAKAAHQPALPPAHEGAHCQFGPTP